jgi:L-aminopeptidase/D-esterase-like protein
MPELVPYVPDGERVLEFEFPGLAVGVAEYEEGPTGCTVVHFPAGVVFAADVRGGAVGTVGAHYGFAHAFCFAGGSLMGLEASAGVAAELFARRGSEAVAWNDVPLVVGAILFDFGPRTNGVYPDKELGRAALGAAHPGRLPMGRRGAGRMATVGKAFGFEFHEPGGQGGAFRQVGGAKVLALCVVNALGAVYDRTGQVVRGNRMPDGRRRAAAELASDEQTPAGNTTLTLVVTDLRLSRHGLQQYARQVHASMARAVQPFNTESDGDVLFLASTARVDAPQLAPGGFGAVASEAVWDAVLNAWEP